MPSDEDFDEPDEPPEPDELLDGEDDQDEDDSLVLDDSPDEEEFVEFDPSGRYGRYAEVLGKGAMKTVYRAYDMADCNEVAWNKARPPVECSDEQAGAVQREIHILQGLHHQGILKLYSAWVDVNTGDANFITELCSTTLLEYRLKHKHISRKAVKNWGRQILKGVAHLHMQNPPIIHRDLKCENILVKCRSNSALKIGDFGSATFLDETHHMHTLVGTPEFMAPEMFQEDYNELVDVYSFGMCMLELLTRECPYSECKSLGQIYKKVINGEKPKALQKVTDVQALRLINRCLLPACKRPSASDLLADPFLQCHEASGQSMKASISMPNLTIPTTNVGVKNMLSAQGVINKIARPCTAKRRHMDRLESVDRDLLFAEGSTSRRALCTKSPSFRRTYRVTGRVEDQYTLRLKIRIQESSRSCDIDFPFDLRFDSPRSVAEEMVRTLDYSQSDLATIADLIREEILALMPYMEEKFPANGSGVNPQGSMLEHGQSSESINAGSPSGQASCCIPSISDELNCKEHQLSKVVSSRSFLSCEGFGSVEEKEDNQSDFLTSSVDGSSMITASTGGADLCAENCGDSPECLSEYGELGNSKFQGMDLRPEGESENSFFCPCSSEQTALVSNGTTNQASVDGLCTLSATGCKQCNPLLDSGNGALTAGATYGSGMVSEDCGRFRSKKRLVLFGSRPTQVSQPHSSPWFKQQLPAGIGILLRPSNEQGFRRALPSCINAFA